MLYAERGRLGLSDGFLHPPFCFFFFFVAFFFVAAVGLLLLTGEEVALAATDADAGTDAEASPEAEVDGGPARAREGLAIMGLQLDATGCRWK